ncbi:histidine phosphatase family protein [Gordonia sp. NB41Y]|uniref:histidine phosphatase family protein n=1 Tax=Gordonia sp. NB41Y TaxID=875808 RepID=UPI0006B239B6|nr:histidine phosphatase family protein [Gordonia sp. NB41Y]EMP12114.2 phosphoglycerate mutase [Gordonia sp. NB41Y]WLP92886.1 histidine phosphatase family protein [Gordonia sp. NB41Y]
MELLLIRHGRPFHVDDPAGADPQLTPEGEDQAARLAKALAGGRHGRVERMVSSPMRRAHQTAQAGADALGLELDLDPRLAEFDLGWTSYGTDLSSYTDRREIWADLNAGRLRDNSFDPEAFRRRVVAGVEEVISARRDAGDGHDEATVAIVCHGGVINAYLTHILGLPQAFFTDPFYTSVTRVLARPGDHREILSVNEVDHLR